jgi:hypothetical protein
VPAQRAERRRLTVGGEAAGPGASRVHNDLGANFRFTRPHADDLPRLDEQLINAAAREQLKAQPSGLGEVRRQQRVDVGYATSRTPERHVET